MEEKEKKKKKKKDMEDASLEMARENGINYAVRENVNIKPNMGKAMAIVTLTARNNVCDGIVGMVMTL